ncbi:MAG: YfiR family protein [Candidatus Acidiferrales bacterium]
MKISAIVVLGAVTGLVPMTVPRARGAQGPSVMDYEAQSEYLRSLADFIDWPSSASNRAVSKTINFCVLGRDPYGEMLNKSVLDHPLGERRTVITRALHLEDLGTCDILFISSSEVKHEAKILERLRNKDVLTVGDTDDFAARGGIIQFVMNQGHVSFLINVDAAQRAGLRIRASLLALAKIVHDQPGKSGG